MNVARSILLAPRPRAKADPLRRIAAQHERAPRDRLHAGDLAVRPDNPSSHMKE